MASHKGRSCLFAILLFIFASLIVAIFFVAFVIVFPQNAISTFGEPDSSLPILQQILYANRLFFHRRYLTSPVDIAGNEIPFQIEMGELVDEITSDLREKGLILNATAFREYLIFTGLDKNIQAGNFVLNTAMNSIQVAHSLLDATPSDITFSILPGWRVEEIAASLPTSGLTFSAEEFLELIRNPEGVALPSDFLSVTSLEGYLLPGAYELPRVSTAQEMVERIISEGWTTITPEMKESFSLKGMTTHQAFTLASIIQREAVVEDEMPRIASVFHNRLSIHMKLDSDPTVQYALGFDSTLGTWWKSKLTYDDLRIDDPYNTYLPNSLLPPGPICSPSLSAINAVAFPAQSPYYYFKARSDGSGLHCFVITLDEQRFNSCP